MNRTQARPQVRVFGRLLFLVLAAAWAWSGKAQSIQHLTVTQPGGMPGLPVMTGISPVTNGVMVTWDGPAGYYQLFRKQPAPGAAWLPVGGPTNLVRRATVPATLASSVFQVGGPQPKYGGAQLCGACHGNIHNAEMNTRHAQAFQTLKTAQQDKNPSCLPCHTVGYGLPTGFISETATPQLAGVQCENCHGPAGNHAANETDPTVRPRVELAATVCGGCHTASNQPTNPPTYEEWKRSAHPQVVEDMNPTNRIDSCGRCHSGSARMSLLKGWALPAGDANIGVGCATCHDSHNNHVYVNVLNGVFTNLANGLTTTNNQLGPIYTNQVRNPLASTNDYFLATSDVFSNKYDPNINVCAQCHNHRGASWETSDRPPHPSLQYNMLLGTVGGTNSVPPRPGFHANVEKQCVGCHMQTAAHQNGPPEVAAVSGHNFRVNFYEACGQCHGSNVENLGLLVTIAQTGISNSVQEVKTELDTWATTKADPSLQSKYGTRAWEYTNPGSLSSGGPGPNGNEQGLIPNNIKAARFNLYLVVNDGSLGVHNINFAYELLGDAQALVEAMLNQ